MEEKEIVAIWKEFLANPDAAGYFPTKRNNELLYREAIALGNILSAHRLVNAYERFKNQGILDESPKPVAAAAPVVQVEPTQSQRDAEDPKFPVQLPAESSWEFQRRVAAYRTQKAESAARQKQREADINTRWTPNAAQMMEIRMREQVLQTRRNSYMRPPKGDQ